MRQLLIFVSICLLLSSCAENNPPTCIISGSADGDEIMQGTAVKIRVEADDEDDNLSEIVLYIDTKIVSSSTGASCSYIWNTDSVAIANHTIKATTTDDDGAKAGDEIMVSILSSSPIAGFGQSETYFLPVDTVTFSDSSVNNPTSWLWTFDGGIPSTSGVQNPTVIYDTPGTYTVSLTVTNAFGTSTMTKTDLIHVWIMNQPCEGASTVTDSDGNTYNTVQIGAQCWMAENLNVGVRVDHVNPSFGSDSLKTQTDNGIIEKNCYDDDEALCDVYGGMYEWDEMMQYNPSDDAVTGTTQGICPDGWHIPTFHEWEALELYFGPEQVYNEDYDWYENTAGGKLKDNTTEYWYGQNFGATNLSGFTALPGGLQINNGWIVDLTLSSWFSSSTEPYDRPELRRTMGVRYERAATIGGVSYKYLSCSVRCIKN